MNLRTRTPSPRPVVALAALAAALLCGSARAALISHEEFAYAGGMSVSGVNRGLGWQSGWFGGGTVAAPGLVWPGLVTTSNALQNTGTQAAAQRQFTTTGFDALRTGGRFGLDGTELWLSFLIRREMVFPSGSFGGVSLLDGNTQELFVGIPTASTHWSFQLFDLGTAPANLTAAANAPIVAGETTLLVMRLRFGVSGVQDQVDLFVNPPPGTPPAAPSATRAGADIRFNALRIQAGPFAANSIGAIRVDELRLGETFADVTPFVPGPGLVWLRPGEQRVSAGAAITLPLACAWPDGDPSTLSPVVTAADGALLPPDRIRVTGAGANRRVTLEPPAGPGGRTTVTATITSPGSASVSADFDLVVDPTPPEGLLVHDPFDYEPRATPIAGKAGGEGFSGAWLAGIPGTPSGNGMVAGSSNLVHAGLATTGVRMRVSSSGAQAIQRPLALPLGDEGTVRYISLLARPDNQPSATAYFGLLVLGNQAANLFVGKPGGGQSQRYVLEDAGGARQIASGRTVVNGETSLLVLKMEFRDGADRVSLFVNPPLTGAEPAVADAVKEDLDLGIASALALNGNVLWSADELRVGTTFASVTPASGPEREFALAPVPPLSGREHQPVPVRITTVAPPPEGRTLAFAFVGDAPGAALDPVTGDFAWTPGELDGGATRTFTVRATSDATPPESDEVRFTVEVAEANTLPELGDPGSLTVEEGTPLSLPLSASDADMPVQSLVFSLISGPEGLAISEAGLLTWTPAPAQLDQVHAVTAQVLDEQGGQAQRTFSILTRSAGGGTVPPPLLALLGEDAVALQWENLAGSFVLQASADLASAPWMDLTVSPVLVGGMNQVLRPLTNAQEFFRLVSRGAAGRLTGAVPEPGGLAPGLTRLVVLTFSDPPASGDVLEVTETTAGLVHTRRIPAEFLTQPDGALGFFLNGDDVPLGTPRVTIRLVGATGVPRGVASFDITNLPSGTGGEPPQLGFTVWGPPAGAVRRPVNALDTVRPSLFVGLADPDGDLARLELAFSDALGNSIHRIIPVAQTGADPLSLILYPLAFGRDSATGEWNVSVTAFDRAGNSAGPRIATLRFGDAVPGNAVLGPQLVNIQPSSGAPGDVVELTVLHVPDLAPTNARVRFGSRPATVVEATGNRLRVVVPSGTAGGRVEVDTAQGASVWSSGFTVLALPQIEPANVHALAGQAIQFRLDRPVSPTATVAWSVDGGGTVDAAGLFRAPDHFTEAGEVTVTASIATPGGNHVATARVTVEAAPVARGSGLVVAASGGTVWSDALLGRVDVPAGALRADTTLTVTVPSQEARPEPPAGFDLIGLLDLGPGDGVVTAPIAAIIPLLRSMTPGDPLELRRWDANANGWVDDGLTATVEADGQSARSDVQRLGLLGLVTPTPAPALASGTGILVPASGVARVSHARTAGGGAPRIATVTPTFLYEGELRPILLEGSDLDGAIQIAVVRDDGSLMPGIGLGPFVRARVNATTAEDTRAGFMLDCPVLPALAEGQTLMLRIRLRKPGHPDVFVPLRLLGLPEFDAADLAGPMTPDRTFSRVYSRIEIRATLRSAFDVTDLRATREIRMLAGVDASGEDGRSGVGHASGTSAAPRRFRTGGAGGTPDGSDAEFLALYEMPSRHLRVGHGGIGGAALSDLANLLSVAGCLGSDARECFNEILEDLRDDPFDELDDAPDELLELLTVLPDGRRGASGMWNGAPTHWFRIPSGAVSDNASWSRRFGPGSGGGGGGQSGMLYGDPATRLGGGSGGEGGGAIRLLSGRGLMLAGHVRANGGDGGNGAQQRVAGVVLSGGGGGGGGAGAIRILAGEGLRVSGGAATARSGRVGVGGIATRKEGIGFGLQAELPYTEDPDRPEGMIVMEGALFDENRLFNAVVTRGVLTLEPARAPALYAFDGRPGLSLDPNRPHIVVSRFDGSDPRRCYFYPVGDPVRPRYRIHLLLHPGANLIALGGPGERMLDRHVVFLAGPDTDADGIADADEAALGTNPAAPDTDGDGLGDFDELANGGNPARADSDGDLLPDNVEIALGTLPTQPDSDGDGLWDSLEVYRNQSPTEARSSAFSYTDGEIFAVVDNEAGEKLLALLDPVTGRLGALGRLPRNNGDGIAFDPRGTLYVAQGDELFEWAGSIPHPRGNPPTGPIRSVSSGGPGSSGGGVVGFMAGAIPPTPAGAGNAARDFRTLVGPDGTLKLTKLGDLRSENALGGFVLPVQAGPLSHDPFILRDGNRLSGVEATPGSVGQTFHLAHNNAIESPLVRTFIPGATASTAIKSLAFGLPTGRFALLAGPMGGDDLLQELDPYNGGGVGPAYALGRADAMSLVHVDTNRFVATTATRDVLSVELQPAAGTLTVTPLSFTVAPVSRLARVPCAGGCFHPNAITGTGPLGPNFRAQGAVPGDFNGDGFPDLAIAGDEGQEAIVHILHGDGTGRFNAVQRHVLGQGAISAHGRLALGRLDGDPHRDLAIAWVFSTFFGQQGHLAVLRGTPNGHFASPLDHPLTPPAEGFAIGPFDGQHHNDLVFGNGRAFLVPTDAGGALDFGNIRTLLAESHDTSLAEFADLDGDGDQDLIRLGEILSVHESGNLTAGFFTTAGFGGADGLELGDHDGDGNTDLFAFGYSGFVRVFPGNGDRTFDPSIPALEGQLFGSIPQIAVADLDGDGRSEIVMPDSFDQRALIYVWDPGLSRYNLFNEFPLNTQPLAARVADANGDGLPDLVLVGDAGSVEVILGR